MQPAKLGLAVCFPTLGAQSRHSGSVGVKIARRRRIPQLLAPTRPPPLHSLKQVSATHKTSSRQTTWTSHTISRWMIPSINANSRNVHVIFKPNYRGERDRLVFSPLYSLKQMPCRLCRYSHHHDRLRATQGASEHTHTYTPSHILHLEYKEPMPTANVPERGTASSSGRPAFELSRLVFCPVCLISSVLTLHSTLALWVGEGMFAP